MKNSAPPLRSYTQIVKSIEFAFITQLKLSLLLGILLFSFGPRIQAQEVEFVTSSWYAYPDDENPVVGFSGDKLGECSALFKNDANNETCFIIMDTDCPWEDCAIGRCSLELDLPGTNFVWYSARKIASGSSYSDMRADWVENGMVSILDVVAIDEHLLDEEPFFAMIQYIQADVNGDLEITTGNDPDEDDTKQIQNLILGYTIPPLPPWTFISDKWFSLQEDFFDGMFQYEPSYEDFQDFYALYYEAFNRIDNNQLIYGSWHTSYTAAPGVEQLDRFNGFKLGDLNYQHTPNDDCALTCFNSPEDNDIAARSSKKTGTQSSFSLVHFDEFSELTIFIDNVSIIHALQFEFNFETHVDVEVELIKTTLPEFNDENFFYDPHLKRFRCAWSDRQLKPELRDITLNESTTFVFRIYHPFEPVFDMSLTSNPRFNLVGNYGSLNEIPLLFERRQEIASRDITKPIIGSDYIEFSIPSSLYDASIKLTIYTLTGQLVESYLSSAIDLQVRFDLSNLPRGGSSCFIYQLSYSDIVTQGKFVILNK